MAITLGLVEAVDSNGVYVSMPGSRGVLRGPYRMVNNVAVGASVLVVGTDDGEQVAVGVANSGRSKTGVFNVREYGARSDVNYDSAGDIQAAIDAAETAGGGIVYIPAGYYSISEALTIPTGVTVQGDGPYLTVILSSSTTDDFFTSTDTALVAIRDLQLESRLERTAGAAINFVDVSQYVIDNVRFLSPFNVADFDGCHGGWLNRIKVVDNVAPSVLNRGLWFQSCVDTHITAVLINGGATVLPSGSAWITFDSGCDTFIMDDVTALASSGEGVPVLLTHSLSPASFAPQWGRISNFILEGSSSAAGEGEPCVKIEAGLSVYFSNGYFATGKSGAEVTGGKDIRFSQCLFINNWLYGALLNSVGTIHNVSFADCTFSDNSQGLTNNTAHVGIASPVTSVRITDCYFGQTILGSTNQAKYAVETDAVSREVVLRGCVLEGPFGTAVIGGSTKPSLRDNRGYNPIGAVTPAVPASTTPLTNSTGVDVSVYVAGGTVSAIAVGGTATGLTGGMVRVADGQTITLTYTVAPTWVWLGD